MFVKNVIDTLDSRSVNDTQLHHAMFDVLKQASALDKREIVQSVELASVFRHPVMERRYMRQIVTWIESYSPIRVKFKKNGQFDKIGFAKNPAWDLERAENDRWYNHEAIQTKAAAKGSLDRAMQTLAREVARVAFESGNMSATVEQVRDKVRVELMALVLAEMEGEKFQEWATKRKAAIEQAKRELNHANAQRSAEVVSMIERARAGMGN